MILPTIPNIILASIMLTPLAIFVNPWWATLPLTLFTIAGIIIIHNK